MTEPLAIVGPPGTGKTHYLMEIVEDRIRNLDYDPSKIGFFSFTRKAAEEARDRAARNLGLDVKQMHHFRTLHSLAFRQLGLSTKDVINASDFKTLEKALGVEFQSTMSMKLEDGEFFRIGRDGDFYLTAYNLSRVKGTDPMREFGRVQEQNHRLSLGQYRLVINAYNTYRQKNKRIDFVDMIEMFVDQQLSPQFDLLIVDEAQDLVPLQWKMIDAMAECAKEVVYAGDDDQCIYEWTGVNPTDYITRCSEPEVLDISYRVPRSVHEVSGRLIKRVSKRVPKVWEPMDREGSVSYHWDINAIDMTEGNWMVLCRTNNIANNIGNQLKNNGYLFYRQGSGFSASAKVIESIKIWTRLSRGEFITQADLKRMWQLIDMDKKQRRVGNKLVKTWEPEQMVSIDVLTDIMPEDNWKEPWFKALKINEGEQLYLRSVLRSGDKFDEKNPRIRLSTIHKVKGGECDNVIVLLDSSRGCQTFGQEDAEIRTFYVGLTRAKENLHIIESNDRWAFKL